MYVGTYIFYAVTLCTPEVEVCLYLCSAYGVTLYTHSRDMLLCVLRIVSKCCTGLSGLRDASFAHVDCLLAMYACPLLYHLSSLATPCHTPYHPLPPLIPCCPLPPPTTPCHTPFHPYHLSSLAIPSLRSLIAKFVLHPLPGNFWKHF